MNIRDEGHELTDEKLEALKKKLKAQYDDAAKAATKKFNDYMASFNRKDIKHKQDVAEGRWTQEDYDNWRRNQLLVSSRLAEARDTIAEDLQHVDKLAMSMVREHQADVYALNHNYGTYEVEKGGNCDTSYTLYDIDTVERLMADDPDLLPPPSPRRQAEIDAKDLRWNKEKLTSSLTTSILTGESIPSTAKRLQAVVGMDYNSAKRAAQTMTTSAECAGRIRAYKRAENMGIKGKKKWCSMEDAHVRPSHQLADGQVREYDEEFNLVHGDLMYPGDPSGPPAEVYNCFTGDTLVAADCQVEKSYCHEYEGLLVRIKTASGVQFTCTPNHPILTPDGWVSANRFHKGDHLLVKRVGDERISRVNPDIDHVFARIDAIHQFSDESGSEQAGALSVNFHGDRPTTDVEVVTHKRLLWRDRDTCKALSFLWWRVRHSGIHTFRPTANRDVVLPEYSIDDLPAETVIRGELLDGLAGKVLVDDVVSVEIGIGKTNVYNLQTESGYYFVSSKLDRNRRLCNGNAVIAKNCRCTLEHIFDGFDFSNLDSDVTTDAGTADLSFSAWEDRHR